MEQKSFQGWFLIEQMGYKRIPGWVHEETIAGCGFLRIEIPGAAGENRATQWILPSTIYAITPISEELARALAAQIDIRPPSVLQLDYEKQRRCEDAADGADDEW